MDVSDPSDQGIVLDLIHSVDSWPRAMVAMTLIVAVVLYVIVRRTRDDVKGTRDDVQVLRRTLTTNNGGSHVKDDLDAIRAALGRLEDGQGTLRSDMVGVRVEQTAIRAEQATARRQIARLDQRLDDHLTPPREDTTP